MANTNAGNDLQLAIAEGRVKQCSAVCKATQERCKRAARDGYDVCSVHGAGTKKRELSRIKLPPGKPANPETSSIYAPVLTEEHKDVYNQVFGDLTLVHEVAALKTLFYKLLKDIEDEESEVCSERSADADVVIDGETGNVLLETTPHKKGKTRDKLTYLIKMAETVLKTATAAHEQLKGKKITVAVQSDQAAVIDIVNETVDEELRFLQSCLCPDCRRRVAEALAERTQTVLEH